MRPPLRKLLKTFTESIIVPPHGGSEHDEDEHSELGILEKAKREWLAARHRFEHTTDPDLIDHAIYELWAAEQKYRFLLKKAREHQLTNDVLVNPWSCLR